MPTFCAYEATIEEGEASVDGYGPPGDDYSAEDIDPEDLQQIRDDCHRFQAENQGDIAVWSSEAWSQTPAEMAGTCFWKSRNGWCGGFQGRDWPEPQASRLAAASKAHPRGVVWCCYTGLLRR